MNTNKLCVWYQVIIKYTSYKFSSDYIFNVLEFIEDEEVKQHLRAYLLKLLLADAEKMFSLIESAN